MASDEKKDARAEASGDDTAAETETGMPRDDVDDLPTSDEDWDSRVLCSDESCIGVIGPDGRCRQCGKPAGPDYQPAGGKQDAVELEAPSEESLENAVATEDEDIVDEDLVIDDAEWEQRILCSDESCIGVIGPDGRCRQCGRPYQPEDSS